MICGRAGRESAVYRLTSGRIMCYIGCHIANIVENLL
jgi:hypothetical protein